MASVILPEAAKPARDPITAKGVRSIALLESMDLLFWSFSGLTASVHQRPLTIAAAAVWCHACETAGSNASIMLARGSSGNADCAKRPDQSRQVAQSPGPPKPALDGARGAGRPRTTRR